MTIINGGLPTEDGLPPEDLQDFLSWLHENYGGWADCWNSIDEVPDEILKEAGRDMDKIREDLQGGKT